MREQPKLFVPVLGLMYSMGVAENMKATMSFIPGMSSIVLWFASVMSAALLHVHTLPPQPLQLHLYC